jgi:tetratricopeptide (TPR) repeat protein
MLADTFQNTGNYAEMLTATDRMKELAEDLHDDEAIGRAHECRGAALLLLGRITEAKAALDTAIELLERVGEVRGLRVALTNMGEARLLMGDLTGAIQVTRRAMDLGIKLREGRQRAFGHLNLAQLLLTAGEWDAAAEEIDRAEELAGTLGTGTIVGSVVLHTKGDLALRRGEWQEARRLLTVAEQEAAGTFQQVSDMARVDLAELDILEGQADDAYERLKALSDGETHTNAVAVLAWAQLERGEAVRALELTDAAERESREQGTVFYLPEVLRIKGLALVCLGRSRDARAIWDEGREWARQMPNPYCEARICREMGALDAREGSREPARRHLQEALSIFRGLGAGKDMERTEGDLAALERSPDVALG